MSPELMHLVGGTLSVLGLVGTAIWWCVRRHIQHLWVNIHGLESRRKSVEAKLERAQTRLGRLREGRRKNKARAALEGERIRELEKQFEEALAEKERLRTRGFQVDVQLRKVRELAKELYRDKRDLEQQFKNQAAEMHTLVRTCRDQQENVSALERQIAELRQSGGMDADVAALIQNKDRSIFRYQEDARLLAEQLEKKDSSLEALREASRLQEKKIEDLLDELEELGRQHQEQGVLLDQKVRCLEESQQKAGAMQKQLASVQDEYQRVIAMTVEEPGRIWERTVAADAPRFMPLAERALPIISIINLKGGVGKTTLTANLAATLGLHGKRVLLVDLDYQRSLTRLCLEPSLIGPLHEQHRTLQDFLLHAQTDAGALLNCAVPLKNADGCEIVVNAESTIMKQARDGLEDTEMRLQAQWLVNPAGRDVRFLLRQALHSPAVRQRYDYVLLDCPPRMSTACINALAASDFVLIPVMLDSVSSISAPNLLRRLQQLRAKEVLGSLGVLGVIANRVQLRNGELIKAQAAEWDEVRVPCKEAWGQSIHFFETVIKQSASIAHAAHQQTFAAFADELKPVFSDLVAEMEKRITYESRRLATVLA